MQTIRDLVRMIVHTFRLMIGVPAYEVYVEHRRRAHPGEPVMTYAEFFRDRQERRYSGNGATRCC